MSDEHRFPSQLAERFQVRMPDGLRDRIRDAAEANSRSMNSEIVARLEASFHRGGLFGLAAPPKSLDPETQALIDAINVYMAQRRAKEGE